MLEMSGRGDTGDPDLPAKVLRIALPPDADLDSVKLEYVTADLQTLEGTFSIAPMPAAATEVGGQFTLNSASDPIVAGKNVLVYGSSEIYDPETCTLFSTQQMGRWKIADVLCSPFAYRPSLGELSVAEDVSFTLTYEQGDPLPDSLLANTTWDAAASELLVNYDQANPWYESDAAAVEPGSNGTGEYVIITTSAIQSGSAQLSSFVSHKQSLGYTVQVVTESAWGGSTGNSAAENIRSWLQSNYAALGIEYVLLIGNPHPTSGDVPMKMMYPRNSQSSYKEAPTDYYYADLTSNWDSDGDGFYGEWIDDFSTQPIHEVIVGRIPVYGTSYTTLDSILTKTINYETETSIDWRQNVLLPMAISNYANEGGTGYNRVDGESLAQYIEDDIASPNSYGTYKLYEKSGIDPVPEACDAPITRTNVINTWSTNPYGIVDWWGHGSQTGAYRKYWASDDGDGVPESGEMTSTTFFDSSATSSLDDTKPSVVVQVSCNNGYPENSGNLGYSLLANGAIGTFSGSRVTWYAVADWRPYFGSSMGDNASYAYSITHRMVADPESETTGGALQWCRENFGTAWSSGSSWMNTLDFNLYGDPTITLGARSPADELDFGDAPDPAAGTGTGNYSTLLSDNGPRHTIVGGLYMGATVDGDNGLLQNASASADDFDQALPDDEDGLSNPTVDLAITVGTQPALNLYVTNTTGNAAMLYGWIDYNSDGMFDNTTERALIAVPDGASGELVTLAFPVVPDDFTGTTYARFRFSTDAAAADSTGAAADGEVEDYTATIVATSGGTVNSYQKISSTQGGFTGILDDNQGFGSSLANIGDVDGDGVSDLAVGQSPNDDGGVNRGAVWILFLNPNGTVKGHRKISDTEGNFTGTLDDYDNFGVSLASVGDLDADGVPDLAAGAMYDDDGADQRGAVWVLFLNADGTVKSYQKISDTEGGLSGAFSYGDNHFGSDIENVGDLDGDGVIDLAVGEYGDNDGGTNRGAVFILFMNPDGTVKEYQKISDTEGNFTGTLDDYDHFGASVVNLGDLDGDGVADLAVGAQEYQYQGTKSGTVWILFLNSDGTVKAHQEIGAAAGGFTGALDAVDDFGFAGANVGDLDGDGVTDLAVGAWRDDDGAADSGAVWILFLNPDGTVKGHQKISDTHGNLTGVLDSQDYFGGAIANLGDLNGDGLVDLVVSSAGDDDGGPGRGAVYVLFLDQSNSPPTVTLQNMVTTLAENTDTSSRLKVADILVTDDGLGTNVLSLAGADAAMFEILGSELYLVGGAVLDFETNPQLDVTIAVDDESVGTTPDDTAALAIVVTDVDERDFGDAPLPYPTTLALNGARHTPTGPTLGSHRDSEFDGVPSTNADGDDVNGSPDDEDGLVGQSVLARGEDAYLDVQVSAASYLNLWIDCNGDGDWNDAGEHIIGTDIPMTPGVNRVSFSVPQAATLGQTFARLRLTSNHTGGTLAPTGPADNGEVEDYSLIIGDVLPLSGKDAFNDVISIWPGTPGGASHVVDINGTVTPYNATLYNLIRVDALTGNDTITVYGTDGDESAILRLNSVNVSGPGYEIRAVSIETIVVNAGGGTGDEATLYGSTSSNRLYSYADYARLTDSARSFSHRVEGFETLTVDVSGGSTDSAYLYDTPDDDELTAEPGLATFTRSAGSTAETTTIAIGFQQVYTYATEGEDTAAWTASDATQNRFYSYADYALLTEARRSFYFYARGFDSVTATSPASLAAYAYLYDSPGIDAFIASTTSATMNRGDTWSDTIATGFARIYAYSTRGGADTAVLNGSSAGGNNYRGYPAYSTLYDSTQSFYHYVRGFHSVTAAGSKDAPSRDRAYLYDSPGADTFDEAFWEDDKYQGGSLTDTGNSYELWIKYFDYVYARSTDSGPGDTIAVENERLLAYRLLRMGTW